MFKPQGFMVDGASLTDLWICEHAEHMWHLSDSRTSIGALMRIRESVSESTVLYKHEAIEPSGMVLVIFEASVLF